MPFPSSFNARETARTGFRLDVCIGGCSSITAAGTRPACPPSARTTSPFCSLYWAMRVRGACVPPAACPACRRRVFRTRVLSPPSLLPPPARSFGRPPSRCRRPASVAAGPTAAHHHDGKKTQKTVDEGATKGGPQPLCSTVYPIPTQREMRKRGLLTIWRRATNHGQRP